MNLTRLREKNCRTPDKGATGLQSAGFAIGMRSNRIENSIRSGAWLTKTFGRFDSAAFFDSIFDLEPGHRPKTSNRTEIRFAKPL